MASWTTVPPGRYLAREEILTAVTLDLLSVTKMSVEVYAGDVKLGGMPHVPLAWYGPKGSLFNITDFYSIIMTRCPHQIFLHTPLSEARTVARKFSIGGFAFLQGG